MLGAYSALERQVALGSVKQYTPRNVDVVIIDGKARGIIARNLITGKLERHFRTCSVLASVDMETYFIYLPMQWALM